MNFKKILLLSAALAIGFVGIGYLAAAETMYGRYGIEILSTNQFNMVRGAYGGLFLTFACLFAVGGFNRRMEFVALVSLCTFMSGFAIGRIASIAQDGAPGTMIYALLTFELFYTAVSAYYIKTHHQA
ncbi:MAG: DUF4345 domain-containing protein [Pseudomonadota bacterium]